MDAPFFLFNQYTKQTFLHPIFNYSWMQTQTRPKNGKQKLSHSSLTTLVTRPGPWSSFYNQLHVLQIANSVVMNNLKPATFFKIFFKVNVNKMFKVITKKNWQSKSQNPAEKHPRV